MLTLSTKKEEKKEEKKDPLPPEGKEELQLHQVFRGSRGCGRRKDQRRVQERPSDAEPSEVGEGEAEDARDKGEVKPVRASVRRALSERAAMARGSAERESGSPEPGFFPLRGRYFRERAPRLKSPPGREPRGGSREVGPRAQRSSTPAPHHAHDAVVDAFHLFVGERPLVAAVARLKARLFFPAASGFPL